MNRDASVPASPWWPIAASLLTGVGGALFLLKAAQLAQAAMALYREMNLLRDQSALLFGLVGVVGAIGVVGIAAAFQVRVAPGQAAAGAGIAGVFGVLLDASGSLAPPRVIPGVLLIAGAAVAYSLRGTSHGSASSRIGDMLGQLVAGAGLLAHAFVATQFLMIGLGAPIWFVAGLYLIWGLMLALALWLRRRYPWLVLAIAPITLIIMDRLVLLADRLLSSPRA